MVPVKILGTEVIGYYVISQLTTNKSSLVWSTTTEEAMKLVSLPERQFVETLNEALVK